MHSCIDCCVYRKAMLKGVIVCYDLLIHVAYIYCIRNNVVIPILHLVAIILMAFTEAKCLLVFHQNNHIICKRKRLVFYLHNVLYLLRYRL